MQELMVKPTLLRFETCKEMADALLIDDNDVMLTNRYLYEPFFSKLHLPCHVVYQEEYGAGEPSDEMAEAIYADLPHAAKRIIAVGGGTIIDLAKFFSLRTAVPILDLYDGKIVPAKGRELIIVPTTCGTGSEVTNVAVLALQSRQTKKGLATDAFYADCAVLVPELLRTLPYRVFATSSIDALVHAVESALSPKASTTTKFFSYRAIEMIIQGYLQIRDHGRDARIPLLADFLLASTYAGIAFGNAGCAAVHAMSYPLGATYHVPHGESNYAMFTGVMKHYMNIKSDGEIAVLNAFIAALLTVSPGNVYEALADLLDRVLPRKPLREYGVTEADLQIFTDAVVNDQKRLTDNNFVPFTRDEYYTIYKELF